MIYWFGVEYYILFKIATGMKISTINIVFFRYNDYYYNCFIPYENFFKHRWHPPHDKSDAKYVFPVKNIIILYPPDSNVNYMPLILFIWYIRWAPRLPFFFCHSPGTALNIPATTTKLFTISGRRYTWDENFPLIRREYYKVIATYWRTLFRYRMVLGISHLQECFYYSMNNVEYLIFLIYMLIRLGYME